MRKRIVCLWLCAISIILSGCKPRSYVLKYHPTEQPGTIWATTDDKISFYCDPDRMTVPGIVETTNGPVEIVLSMSSGVTWFEIALASDYPEDKIDTVFPSCAAGQSSVESIDEFRMRITLVDNWCPSGLFEEGQEFIFYKITDI